MAALPADRQVAVGIEVKGNMKSHQLPNVVGAFGAEYLYGLPVAESRPGHQGVLHMKGGLVVRQNCRGDAALGKVGVADFDALLAEHQNGFGSVNVQRGIEPRNSRTDNEYVGANHIPNVQITVERITHDDSSPWGEAASRAPAPQPEAHKKADRQQQRHGGSCGAAPVI